MHTTSPLVSVVVSARDAERYLRLALESILRQTLSDFELVVVDDGSADGTAGILASIEDPRLRVLRNEESLGLAASLNRALDAASGRFVARLDADDVAMPTRLERQVEVLRANPELAIVGSSVIELEERGGLGALHVMPRGPLEIAWASLFSSPFFHPSVMVERAHLEREGLRYDPGFLESEDFELWTRVLHLGKGDNLLEPLVLYRVHPGQASRMRRELQREFQRRVAVREIARVAPRLETGRAELAWRIGARESVERADLHDALGAFVELAEAVANGEARASAARSLASFARTASPLDRPVILKTALELDPRVPIRVVERRARRSAAGIRTRASARRWLATIEVRTHSRPLRVAAVFPEPTPYRAPLLDRIADVPELDLTVVYAAETVARRTWHVAPRHEAIYLRGFRVPGGERVVRHDYPVTPGIARALSRLEPDVVVVSGWSTFPAQAAIAWCRARNRPYVLVVESHDEGPRPGWRRALKRAVVPALVRHAAAVLVTGSLARRSMSARGADPARIHLFANTIDVEAFAAEAERLRERRGDLRSTIGAGAEDVVVLFVGRLAPEKRIDVLVRSCAAVADPSVLLALVGDGPARASTERLAAENGVRLCVRGDRPWAEIVESYVAADVFALVSERETWGVVVNEAAAAGLPLVTSDRVGAAHDLVRIGENGYVVPAGDVAATAEALRELVRDASLRIRFGERSREIAREWGYGPSVEGFVAAVRDAAAEAQD